MMEECANDESEAILETPIETMEQTIALAENPTETEAEQEDESRKRKRGAEEEEEEEESQEPSSE